LPKIISISAIINAAIRALCSEIAEELDRLTPIDWLLISTDELLAF
jgi:hypothetical protein